MPLIIRTPEQIFREEGKDVYFVRFFDLGGDRDLLDSVNQKSQASEDFCRWMKKHLPHVRVERLAPSEKSGWLEGYFGDIRVDFSDEDLVTFCAHWEDEHGESKDARLRCFVMQYQTWFVQHGNCIPTRERPTKISTTVWWETPIGFIYYQTDKAKPIASHLDIWMHAIKLWPELALLESRKLTHGLIFKSQDDKWEVVITDSPFSKDRFSRDEELLEWFNLPENIQIYRDDW